jgi:iron complex transport system substrate-binding protein
MHRIVSLLPSNTEIACALGFEDALVGRSHECDFPASVEQLPVLTQPKLDTAAGSLEIDRCVRDLVRDGLSVYRVDVSLAGGESIFGAVGQHSPWIEWEGSALRIPT